MSTPPPAPSEGPAPLFRKQKQCAAGAKFWSNHCETGGFSCILATQATAQPPPYPIWTDPTDPARRPSDRPIGPLGPYSWAPLGLSLTALRARAPPGPPVFSVFCFSRPPAAPDPPGRALTGRSKTLRPGIATDGRRRRRWRVRAGNVAPVAGGELLQAEVQHAGLHTRLSCARRARQHAAAAGACSGDGAGGFERARLAPVAGEPLSSGSPSVSGGRDSNMRGSAAHEGRTAWHQLRASRRTPGGVGGGGSRGSVAPVASGPWEAMRFVPPVHAGRGGGRRRGVGRLDSERHLFELFGPQKVPKSWKALLLGCKAAKKRAIDDTRQEAAQGCDDTLSTG